MLFRSVGDLVKRAHVAEMKLAALIHALVTGCPPQRVVAYSLTSGDGFGLDIEREWLYEAVNSVLAALERLAALDAQTNFELRGGPHCVRCPLQGTCKESKADECPF